MDDPPRQRSVLFLKEGNLWVALWLETNIAAQGRNIKAAWRALKDAVEGQSTLDAERGCTSFEGKQRAPEWYWHAYEHAKPLPFDFLDEGSERDPTVHPRQYAQAA
jgi:hypothetical protein